MKIIHTYSPIRIVDRSTYRNSRLIDQWKQSLDSPMEMVHSDSPIRIVDRFINENCKSTHKHNLLLFITHFQPIHKYNLVDKISQHLFCNLIPIANLVTIRHHCKRFCCVCLCVLLCFVSFWLFCCLLSCFVLLYFLFCFILLYRFIFIVLLCFCFVVLFFFFLFTSSLPSDNI